MQQQHLPDHLSHLLDDAVSEVFTLMLDFACSPAPACRSQPPGFSASVHFSGTLIGSCAVHLDLVSAGVLTTQLTGLAPDPGSPLLADIVGELCNMIAGCWKSRLASPFAACHLSPPTITDAQLPTPYTRAYRFDNHCLNLELTLA